jgi:SpoVK/Ycf46/Vps4 family AAA+-type ATPase
MTPEFLNKLKDIEATTLYHDDFQRAIETIDRAYLMKRDYGLSRHLLCVGPSGTGKSTLKKEMLAKYPNSMGSDRMHQPILSVDTPSRPTVRNMAEAMLIALNEPFYSRGSAIEKTHRIFSLMRQQKVEMLIIDELQHFVDRGKPSDARDVSDWLKSVIDQTAVSCVLIGLQRCEEILAYNEQLRRRFSVRLELIPFSIGSKEDLQGFASLVKMFDGMLGFPERLTLTTEFVKTMFYATNGIIDYVRKLLCGAAEIAIDDGSDRIEHHHFEQAFTDFIWHRGIGNLNPFNPKFNNLSLDKPGMPFHKAAGGTLLEMEV